MRGVVSPATRECFVIMPFGLPETEKVWRTVYEPTLKACSLKPVRADRVPRGGPVVLQIIGRLQAPSTLLVLADLTFAKPNCYFELGYAMGLGRDRSVILCCRDDHRLDSPQFKAHKNKVHFDVAGYHVLWWAPSSLSTFAKTLRRELRAAIRDLEREAEHLPPILVKRTRYRGAAVKRKMPSMRVLTKKLERLAEMEARAVATWK